MQPVPNGIVVGSIVLLIMFAGWAITIGLFCEVRFFGKTVWTGPYYKEDSIYKEDSHDKGAGDKS
jgi:hypothetical protein